MKLLALDTSTEACSAALLIAGQVYERFTVNPQGHANLILNMLEAILAEGGVSLNTIDALAFGRGPGSFTGVRIGAGVAQGIAFAHDLPVIPISSLASLAQASGARKSLVAIDARMNEVYWGVYERVENGLVTLNGVECVCIPQMVPLVKDRNWLGVGTGWGVYGDKLRARLGRAVNNNNGWEAEHYPRASATAQLGVAAFARGEAVVAEDALPIYLRNDVAIKTSVPVLV
ncbi:peptidase M22 glycoprotease [Candidatus Nitrosoglobus terrae]|uniref:tRNA threonylcarbamoyladenosine biosynthesis protein TsaB n=1 Tax=Candidatus Nitrosoglobus terrae TaxID=1630141 RepID=A0A1Q2SNQ5_9GAMM|nr:tRNA (adenosine(37)-N6)-threonylcarbamoyltransferase complex dimerization subunit type 1 TsaB [Candidatus Nitrosoglobus terrae]BAW80766.1 peptidase M22 glycoprotease [Candidatus Nitrosoglobus terrae]